MKHIFLIFGLRLRIFPLAQRINHGPPGSRTDDPAAAGRQSLCAFFSFAQRIMGPR